MFRRPRCAMPMSTCFTPASAASAMISSRIGTSMSTPSTENRVLPGNVRCRKRSNVSTSVMRSSSSKASTGSAGARNEPGLGRVPQPRALLGPEDVGVVVAGARAVDAAQPVDGFGRVRRALRDGAARRARPAARRRSASVMPCASGASDGSPQGGVPSGSSCGAEVAVAADRLGQVHGADDRADVGRADGRAPRRVGARRPAGSSANAGGDCLEGRPRGRIDRRGVLAEPLVQLEDVALVHPSHAGPIGHRRHSIKRLGRAGGWRLEAGATAHGASPDAGYECACSGSRIGGGADG